MLEDALRAAAWMGLLTMHMLAERGRCRGLQASKRAEQMWAVSNTLAQLMNVLKDPSKVSRKEEQHIIAGNSGSCMTSCIMETSLDLATPEDNQ